MKLIVLMVSLVLCHQSYAVKTDSPAPAFSLQGHDGKTYSLSDFKGKKSVVLEWYNDDCPYVEKHYGAGNMQMLQQKYGKKGVVWFSIISSAKGKQGFVDQKGATALIEQRKAQPTAILLDPAGKVGRMYGAKTTPHMYIINQQGKLVYQGAIDDKPSARPKSLKGATPLFAQALDASLQGKIIAKATTKPYGCSVKY